MADDARPATVSRRNLVRALLGRNRPETPPPAAADPERHAAGDTAYAAGDYAGAVAAYRASIRGDLSNTAVRLRLGHALYATGQFIQARVEFEHVLRLDPAASPMARLCLGLTLLALGKPQRAAVALRALEDSDQPELTDAARQAAQRLETDAQVDAAALRADLERTARAVALLPETVATV